MRCATILILVLMLVILAACGKTGPSPEAGQNLAVMKGCAACHSVDETVKIGPPWKGLYGSEIELRDGSFVTADENYLIESMKDPNAKIVKGYTKGAMPHIPLTDDEIDALVAYIESVK